jgi:hypothetical protein
MDQHGWANALGTGSTTATFTPPSTVAGTTYYRVLINAANNGCDQAVSNNAVAVIITDLLVTTQPTDVNECIGGTNTMTVVVSGGSGTISYQWQSSLHQVDGHGQCIRHRSSTRNIYTSEYSSRNNILQGIVNAANDGCDQAVSNNAVAVITPDLLVTTQPTDVNECIGGTNTMTVVVSGGSGTISYQWQSSSNGSNGWANALGTVQPQQPLHLQAQ